MINLISDRTGRTAIVTGAGRRIGKEIGALRNQNHGRVISLTSYTGLHGDLGQAH